MTEEMLEEEISIEVFKLLTDTLATAPEHTLIHTHLSELLCYLSAVQKEDICLIDKEFQILSGTTFSSIKNSLSTINCIEQRFDTNVLSLKEERSLTDAEVAILSDTFDALQVSHNTTLGYLVNTLNGIFDLVGPEVALKIASDLDLETELQTKVTSKIALELGADLDSETELTPKRDTTSIIIKNSGRSNTPKGPQGPQ